MIRRRWTYAPSGSNGAARIAEHLGVSPIVAQILHNRGAVTVDDARAFLRPRLDALHEPWGLPDIESAARRIYAAVERGEGIVIYGDYDVDGISATAILLRGLRLLNANVSYYLPDRQEEGYGLNCGAVEHLAGQGARLIVTVDCGVNAVAEIARARELGVDVVVTDHHEPESLLPEPLAMVNPRLAQSTYPFRELAGAGVAFKLAWAVGKLLSEGVQLSTRFKDFLLDSLSLAALGTIADVVPLVGENRVLAHYGLAGLSRSTHVGLAALRRVARVEGEELTAFDVAFKLAPRLNAAGRLGSAENGVELLTTDDTDRATAIAELLDRENTRRRTVQDGIVREARALAEVELAAKRKALVLDSSGWHPGVIGIVASRLVDLFGRPTVLLATNGEEAHGSARSISGFHLFEALHECRDLLTSYGGHAKAAGLRLPCDRVERFRERFLEVVENRLDEKYLVPEVFIDAEVPLAGVTRALLGELEMLQPCGEGNRDPILATHGVEIGSVKRMGRDGKHLSFWVRQGEFALRAVAFNLGEEEAALAAGGACSLAYRPGINAWRGQENIELYVEDVKLDEPV